MFARASPKLLVEGPQVRAPTSQAPVQVADARRKDMNTSLARSSWLASLRQLNCLPGGTGNCSQLNSRVPRAHKTGQWRVALLWTSRCPIQRRANTKVLTNAGNEISRTRSEAVIGNLYRVCSDWHPGESNSASSKLSA